MTTIPLLTGAVKDVDVKVRYGAIASLGYIDRRIRRWPKVAYGILVDALPAVLAATEDSHPQVRALAVDTAANIGGMQAKESLQRAAADEEESVRNGAVSALLRIGDRSATCIFINALSDNSSAIRLTAVKAIREFGGETALAALAPLTQDEDERVRREVRVAVREIKGENTDSLIASLKDDDWLIQEYAVKALMKKDEKRAVEALLIAMDESSSLEGAIRKAFRKSGPEVDELLAQCLSDSDAIVRRNAVRILRDRWRIDKKNFADKEVLFKQLVKQLVKLIKEDTVVRDAAVFALYEMGYEAILEASPILLDVYLESDGVIRKAHVIQALGVLGDRKYVPLFMKSLKAENSWDARIMVLDYLPELGDVHVIPELICLMHDTGWDTMISYGKVEGSALDFLMWHMSSFRFEKITVGEREFLTPFLIKCLKDEKPRVV